MGAAKGRRKTTKRTVFRQAIVWCELGPESGFHGSRLWRRWEAVARSFPAKSPPQAIHEYCSILAVFMGHLLHRFVRETHRQLELHHIATN